MSDVQHPDYSSLSSARLYLQQGDCAAARAQIKQMLAADPTRQEAINLLLEVERQERDQKCASRQAAEEGVKPPFTFLVGLLLLIIAVVNGCVWLPQIPQVGLGGVITYENKGTWASIPAKWALLIVVALGIPGLLMFLAGVRNIAQQLRASNKAP